MAQKHRRTLEAIFEDPVRSNIPWRDVESMLKRRVLRFLQAPDREFASR